MTTANQVDPTAASTATQPDQRPPLFRRRFTKPGAAPGQMAGPSLPDSSRVRVIRYGRDYFEESDDAEPGELPAAGGGGVLWVDLRGVQDHEAVEAVAERFGINKLARADVVNVGQRPKAEDQDGHLFVILRMAVRADTNVNATPAAEGGSGGSAVRAVRAVRPRGGGSRSRCGSATACS